MTRRACVVQPWPDLGSNFLEVGSFSAIKSMISDLIGIVDQSLGLIAFICDGGDRKD